MDQFHIRKGLPPELLEALGTMTKGGVLYAVAQVEQNASRLLVPCWIMRTPATKQQVRQAVLRMSTRLVVYDHVPLVVFHFALYDQPPQIEEVRLSSQRQAVQITPASPFKMEVFLNPLTEEDRLMLQALAESQVQLVEYYLTDREMTYQATKRHPHSAEQRQAARDILHATEGMASTTEHFLAARDRFLLENSLF